MHYTGIHLASCPGLRLTSVVLWRYFIHFGKSFGGIQRSLGVLRMRGADSESKGRGSISHDEV